MTLLDDRMAVAAPAIVPTRRRWQRPALFALLAGTAVLYLWALGSTGFANDYYAAAVQAGTQSWKAWLFGSLDSGNAITVDKPPAAFWVMGASARLLGFSAFSILLPQALMGVGAVALTHAAVRRCSGDAAGLIAGAVLALTPVATVMFRYDQPDALLVLLLTAAGYFMVRAVESGATRWIALAGAVIGVAFLTKMLQAGLVVPGFALAFLVAAPGTVWKRLWQLLIGAVAMVASTGPYVALVSLWPADSRPYIGGSTDNSLLQLALGYNGVQRVAGGEGMPGGGSPMFGGAAGIGRLFGSSMGTEISWLLPAALIGLVAGVWFTAHTPRTDRVRANLLLWGSWLLVGGAVFSFMHGVIHPYYTVALAPAIAAIIGISVRQLWRGREFVSCRVVLAAMSAATGVWSFILLDRTPDWLPALRWTVLVGSIAAAAVIAVGADRLGRATAAVVAAALLFGAGAPAAYAIDTVGRTHSGPMPTSGPVSAAFGPGRAAGGGGQDNPRLKALLENSQSRWAAATVSAMGAAPLELETGASIMAIGGFTGSDGSPTLEQFRAYVADHQIDYFIAGDRGGPPRGRAGAASEITTWVQQHFTAMDVGGTTVYDLRTP
ncbi:MAG TPA: glycosyltransferase family 39 protein [Mycobacterium sp.]|jgi:4-amino-4-deoxy-L-arabinose transferase-like glycosyltransferase